MHLIGVALITIIMVFSVAVTQSLFGKSLPSWYLPMADWTDALDTTTLGLMWSTAEICFGVAVLRTPVMARCAG